MPLLTVKNLSVEFSTDQGAIKAVDNVSFSVNHGETVGLVGESGCGKTVTSLSTLRLVPTPPGNIVSGAIEFQGQQLLELSEKEMRSIRGGEIAMIFQDASTALNPVLSVGSQLCDVIQRHLKVSRKQARRRAVEELRLVGIPSPEIRIKEYPHMLSGGMKQRVMIAMAFSCSPKLLIADEPTTALDVTTQSQVMHQLKKLQSDREMATILVSHDLGVVAEFCETVIVMYCGQIIEKAPVSEIFSNPQHPYTKGLIMSIPKVSQPKLERLPTIKGMVPDLRQLPKGCLYADRCGYATAQCRAERPELKQRLKGEVACFNPVSQ